MQQEGGTGITGSARYALKDDGTVRRPRSLAAACRAVSTGLRDGTRFEDVIDEAMSLLDAAAEDCVDPTAARDALHARRR